MRISGFAGRVQLLLRGKQVGEGAAPPASRSPAARPAGGTFLLSKHSAFLRGNAGALQRKAGFFLGSKNSAFLPFIAGALHAGRCGPDRERPAALQLVQRWAPA